MTDAPRQRFLKLTDIQEILQISAARPYALVRSGDLPAIRIGSRNQWRVETSKLEEYIQDGYRRTAEAITAGLPHEDGPDPDAQG